MPEATFTSYYGRPVVKPSPWKADIPAYFFLGGLAAGSSLLGAGADLNGQPALRRTGRLGALAGISLTLGVLIHDLGRPSRFLNMQRVVKPTSPMSVGTWVLSAYGPLAGLAAVSEVSRQAELNGLLPCWLRGPARLLTATGRPAGIGAALVAPVVASYTAVLLSDTATPTWHDAHRHLPFFFVGSAASAAGGLAMIAAPVEQAGPARRMAVGGVLAEIAADQRMEAAMGLTAEPLHQGKAGSYLRIAKALNIFGTAGTVLFGRRSRTASVVSGAALMAGSAYTRFGIFEAGQQSARDPKYTVVPQRERLNRAQGNHGKEDHADSPRMTPSADHLKPEQKPSTTRSEEHHENRGHAEGHHI
ncbi:MAG TPA: NrfD/PsrC family molybdoenzyme membrane anchor subunit [Streptosporangiaceae bacterium]|nr:NrfD/PsrC family molybdoenzyme membrane anchor subunit [Streptosporangiaceae bacterium]